MSNEKHSAEFPFADRLVFLIYIIIIIVPMVHPFGLPLIVSSSPREVKKAVDDLQPGSVILCELDNGFASIPDIGPGETAFLKYIFDAMQTKNINIIIFSTSIEGNQIAQNELSQQVGRPYPFNTDPTYGKSWVFLGYLPGGEPVTHQMVTNMLSQAPADVYGSPTQNMDIFKYVEARAAPNDIIDGNDINLFMVSHNVVPDLWARQWSQYGDPQNGFPHGNQVQVSNGANIASMSAFKDKGQIRAALCGMNQGAEFESLIGKPGAGASFMDAQDTSHLFGIGLIIIANIIYWRKRLMGVVKK